MFQKICILFLSMFLFCGMVNAASSDKNDFGIEQGLVEAFKTKNPQIIAKKISYPLSRPRPIPSIKDEQDFIKRFDMLFDEAFCLAIAHSTPHDWKIMGWRGTMFRDGFIWLDDEGKINALNNVTSKERQYAKDLTQKEIQSMHPSLRFFKDSKVIFDISLGRGRIDSVANPNNEYDDFYRYAFWNKGKDMSEKPDMLIQDGRVEYYGTANNTNYIFENGGYTYRFEITYVGHKETLPYALVILKDGVEIDSYPANIVQ